MKTPFLTMLFILITLNGCSEHKQTDLNNTAARLARIVADGEDHLTAAELADWLIQEQRDFELIDIRSSQDFTAGHIKGARHVPLNLLLSGESRDSLPAASSIVVYSNGSAHAAQAALLLRLTGREAFALLGGYNYWQAYLHDPAKAGVAEMDPAERARYQAVACYFAGQYVADAGLLPKDSIEAPPTAPESTAGGDPLGLGLGLGLGTEKVQAMDLEKPRQTPEPTMADELGLGLGLGDDTARTISEPEQPPEGETQRLLIRAEC